MAIVSQVNIGTVSKATLWKQLLRDGVCGGHKGLPERIDATFELNCAARSSLVLLHKASRVSIIMLQGLLLSSCTKLLVFPSLCCMVCPRQSGTKLLGCFRHNYILLRRRSLRQELSGGLWLSGSGRASLSPSSLLLLLLTPVARTYAAVRWRFSTGP